MGHSQDNAKRKVYYNTGLHQKRRTIPYEHSKLKINETRERITNEAKVSRRRNIIKIRAEINKIKKKKPHKELMKAGAV